MKISVENFDCIRPGGQVHLHIDVDVAQVNSPTRVTASREVNGADELVARVVRELVKNAPRLVEEAIGKRWSSEDLAELDENLAGGLI